MPQPANPARHRGAALGFAAVCVLVLALYTVAVLLSPTEHADGSCTGIGFGCTLAPRDGLLFLGFLVGLPTLLGTLTIGVAACVGLLRWTRWPGLLLGVISAIGSGIVLAVLVSITLVLFL